MPSQGFCLYKVPRPTIREGVNKRNSTFEETCPLSSDPPPLNLREYKYFFRTCTQTGVTTKKNLCNKKIKIFLEIFPTTPFLVARPLENIFFSFSYHEEIVWEQDFESVCADDPDYPCQHVLVHGGHTQT